ncbi:MAG: hypothetical protein HYU64_12055 [Armatimonadetes bacterium]|nr:hypothetical protein [Armatimonadota bacterium]
MIIHPQTRLWSASKAMKPLEEKDQEIPEAKWGVLVYFASDNDLYKFQSRNLRDLEKVGSSPEMHIVAQMDHGPEKGATLRYYITKSENPSSIQSPVIANLGMDVDAADPKVLKEFVAFSMRNYPAEHYLLVLNGPGAGFLGGLPDQGSGKKMSLPQMREALEEAQEETGRKLDIIGFDSSLMAQAEVAYELKSAGDILLGSEECEWGPGWQYDHIFGAKTLAEVQAILGKKQDIGPEELARKIVSEQEEHQDYIPTFSASRLSEMGELREASDNLARAILEVQSPEEKDVIRRTVANVQHYGGNIAPFKDYRDLGHLAKLISRTAGISPAVKDAAHHVEATLRNTVIATQATNDGYDDSTGLSVYLPYTKGNQDHGYADTQWAKDTLWDEALESLARISPPVRATPPPASPLKGGREIGASPASGLRDGASPASGLRDGWGLPRFGAKRWSLPRFGARRWGLPRFGAKRRGLPHLGRERDWGLPFPSRT